MDPKTLAPRITQILHTYNISALVGMKPGTKRGKFVSTYYSTPVSDVFPVYLRVGTRVNDVLGVVPEVRTLLSQQLGDDVHISTVPNPLGYEIRKTNPAVLPLGVEQLRLARPGTGVLGLNFYNRVPKIVGINLKDPETPHVLFCGASGSGKTSALQNFLLSLAYGMSPRDLEFYFIDLKRRGLYAMSGLPHVRISSSDPDESSKIVQYVRSLVESRKDSGESTPMVVLAVDELAEFAAAGIEEPFARDFPTIARLGRELGVHVISTAQKPESGAIGGQLLQQFGALITGRLRNAKQATDVLGIPNTGAHLLGGKGEMIRVKGGDDPTKFQAFLSLNLNQSVQEVQGKWGGVSVSPFELPSLEEMVPEIVGKNRFSIEEDMEKLRGVFSDYFNRETGVIRHGGWTRMAETLGGGFEGTFYSRVKLAVSRLIEEEMGVTL